MTAHKPAYRKIPLTQGQFAIVDATDYEWLMQWKWFAWRSSPIKHFYAVAHCKDDHNKMLRMHRVILGLGFGDKRLADHKESEKTLDNRRSNLRIATNSQNSMNSRRRRINKSGHKGISWRTDCAKWYVQIMVEGKNHYIGRFDNIKDARRAYKKTAPIYHGEFTRFA